jgi:hypothetical protein
VLETGVGSCAGDTALGQNTYYCGTGVDCNNFVNKTCWNAKDGAASAACTSSDWQCKVGLFKIILKMSLK